MVDVYVSAGLGFVDGGFEVSRQQDEADLVKDRSIVSDHHIWQPWREERKTTTEKKTAAAIHILKRSALHLNKDYLHHEVYRTWKATAVNLNIVNRSSCGHYACCMLVSPGLSSGGEEGVATSL